MAKKEWRAVNDLYFHRPQKTEQKKKPVTLDDEPYSQPQKDEPEVRLLDATWLPGPDGYQFNKKCTLQIKAKFLKKTSNKRVVADTFVLFNGEEEDLGQQVEGFLNDDGIAEAEVMLYYGDKYSDALRDDPDATCEYKCKLKHTKGANEIESELLDMPATKEPKAIVVRLEIDPEDPAFQDATFRLYSTDPNTKYDKTLTVKNDKTSGDKHLDLEFPDVDESLSYTLTIEYADESLSYNIFEDTPYGELSND